MSTEQKLWQLMLEHVPVRATFTRIETLTRAGVSDVEYVLEPWHGWIELKTSSSRNSGPIVLHHPYSLAQLGWLLLHHNPKQRLRSWLLVGFTGPRTWRQFMLLAPGASTHLVHMRKAPQYKDLIKEPHVFVTDNMETVLKALKEL